MISQEELANRAAVAFHGHALEVPDKLWLHSYQDTAFVCAAWANGVTAIRSELLANLQADLSEIYGVPFTAVAYQRDFE